MEFNPENRIVKLCAEGMQAEGQGQPEIAKRLFQEAWDYSTTDFEKFTAAHFVARHQPTTEDKLNWDLIALESAMNITDVNMNASYPSLYLNIGKCYEELADFIRAKENYERAYAHIDFLPENGYGKMIRSGILSALQRIKQSVSSGT